MIQLKKRRNVDRNAVFVVFLCGVYVPLLSSCAASDRVECGDVGSGCDVNECGDGKRRGAEQCDDGNNVAKDGCDSQCNLEHDRACNTDGDLTICPEICNENTPCGQDIDAGKCVDSASGPFCVCNAGYIGSQCQTKACVVAGGLDFTVGRGGDDKVVACGSNADGQIANQGVAALTRSFREVEGLSMLSSDIRMLSASANGRHTLALTDSRRIFAWGNNLGGQLGHAPGVDEKNQVFEWTNDNFGVPGPAWVAAGVMHSIAIRKETIYGAGQGSVVEMNMDPEKKINFAKVAACGVAEAKGGFNLALDIKGNVYTWGDVNNYGQLGTGDTVPHDQPQPVQDFLLAKVSLIAVACGGEHSVAVSNEGEVWAWGRNDRGQLGGGSLKLYSADPVRVLFDEGVKIRAIASGADHSIALDRDGDVWAWGDHSYGQLGVGNDGNTSLDPRPRRVRRVDGDLGNVYFIAAGAYHSLALDKNGSLWSWGDNEVGQLGTGDDVTSFSAVRSTFDCPVNKLE